MFLKKEPNCNPMPAAEGQNTSKTHCAIIDCENHYLATEGTSFHRFPANSEHSKEWIRFTRRANGDPNYEPLKSSKICSLHFSAKDLQIGKNGKTCVAAGAVPEKLSSGQGKPVQLLKLSINMCRICLKSVSPSSANVSVVAEMYREVTDFVIQPTDVPRRLCFECHNLIQELYGFVQTCRRTEEILRTLQGAGKIEPEQDLALTNPIETCFVADAHIKEEIIVMECNPEIIPQSPDTEFKEEDHFPDPEPFFQSEEPFPGQREKCFECHECGRKFAYRNALKRHLESHNCSSDSKFPCPVEGCNRTFLAKRLLKQHESTVHNTGEYYECSECEKTFTCPKYLKIHKKRHSGRDLSVCEVCGKTMLTKYVKYHRQTMHGDQPYKEPRIPCESCGKLIAKHNMSVHRRTHIPVPKSERLLCDMCPKRSFKYKQDLARHMVESHILHIVKKPQQRRPNHSSASSKGTLYPCSYCEKTFNARMYRKGHELAVHLDAEKQVACVYEGCTKMFHMEYQLKVHIKAVHPQMKNCVCPTCGKCFKSKGYLKNHRLTHSRSYVCPYKSCQRTYSHGFLLRDHMRKVHPEFKMPPKGTKLFNVDLSIYFPTGSQ